MVGFARNVGKIVKDRGGFGKMTSDGFESFGKKLGEMKSKADAKWAEEVKNRDKKVDKAWGEDRNKTESSTKEALANFKKQTGIQMSTSTMLRQSQIFTSSIGAIFQMVGAVIDILLMPLVPLLIPLMQLFSKFVIPVFMQMTLDILRVIKWFKQAFAWATGPNGDFISNAIKAMGKWFGVKSEKQKEADEKEARAKARVTAWKEAAEFFKTNKEELEKLSALTQQGIEGKMINSEFGKKGATIGQRMLELGTRDVLKRQVDYTRAGIMGRGQRSGLFKSEDYQYTPGEMYAMGLDPYKAIPPHMRGSGSSATDLKGGAQAAGNLILDGINYLGERIGIWGGKNESSSTAEQNNQSGKSWFNMDFKSDSTLKDNVETIPNALEKIESLRGVHFTWKDTNQAQMGVIAQELEQVYPELVHETEEGVKMVEYSSLIGVLIEAVKDLNKQVKLQKVGV